MTGTIAVTGGTGFIGWNLVDRLVGEGYEVVIVDSIEPTREDVSFRDVDIRDSEGVSAAIKGCDAVFHLAAVSNVDHAFRDPIRTVEANIVGLTNVLEAARQNDVGRVVFASTVWVYSGCRGDGPLTEEDPFYLPDGGHIYTSSKIAGEMILHNYSDLYGQRSTILRYGIPYGPRMRKELVIPIFVGKALRSEPIVIQGDGSQYRNYLYVDDLVEANVLALRHDTDITEVYNLEGPEKVTIRDIVETIQRVLGREVAVEYVPAREGDYKGRIVSADKAARVLGWKARVQFEEGMRRYIEWYRASERP
jgi:UDP-glucose 4-epimerase